MMPKVIGSDSLIARVNEVQGRMYRQSNELGRLNRAVKRYKEENAKLRELVLDMWHELDAATQYDAGGSRGVVLEYRDIMRELGVKVDE